MSSSTTLRSIRSALACGAVSALAALMMVTATAEGATQRYGFNDLVWGNPSISHSVAKTEFAKAGASYWRLPLSWQYFEPVKGTYDPTFLPAYMDTYNQMIANGQTPIFIVTGTPYWALTQDGRGAYKWPFYCGDNRGATVCNAPPDVRAAAVRESWQMFLMVMSYFMPKAVFEIWNEPNSEWFWMQEQDPELYGEMLKSAADAIHSVSPDTKVLSGSVTAYSGPDTTANTGYASFLSKVYEVAGTSAFDAIGLHASPCNHVPTAAGWTQAVATTVAGVRAARNAAGDTTRPLWLTETEAGTGAASEANCGTYFTEAQQGSALSAVLAWAKAENATRGDLPVVVVQSLFNAFDRSNVNVSNGLSEGEFGLIAWSRNSQGVATTKPKPALQAVTCAFRWNC